MQAFIRRQFPEQCHQRGFTRIEDIASLLLQYLLRCIDNGRISGTTAQVTGKHIVDGLTLRASAILNPREHRHDETRRAETALGTMLVDHGLLDRMEVTVAFQIFDGDQRLSIERADELNAGIDRAVVQLISLEFGYYSGACAAITLGTSFFRTHRSLNFTQVTKHCQRWIDLIQTPELSIQNELDFRAHIYSFGHIGFF
jgi:hypothetical protein